MIDSQIKKMLEINSKLEKKGYSMMISIFSKPFNEKPSFGFVKGNNQEDVDVYDCTEGPITFFHRLNEKEIKQRMVEKLKRELSEIQ